MTQEKKYGIFAPQSGRPFICFLYNCFLCLALVACLFAPATCAQTIPPPPSRDILIFANGDRLTGTLERSDGEKVIFKADMAGEITVKWSKIQELHTDREFAVIPNGVNVKKGENPEKIPHGTLSVVNQQINLRNSSESAAETIPTADSAYIVDQATFQNAVLNGENLFKSWNGSVTLGTSLVEATQKSNTLSGAASLLRVTPREHWLDRRDRTTLNLSFAYGTLSQPNTPDVKTDIYHVDAERDQYFTSRLFAFGLAAFDHNFSQGLDLQQSYGAGIGWTVVKNPTNELNLRSSVNYLKQQFQDQQLSPGEAPEPNQNLIASTFTETFMHRFAHDIILTEQGSATPAWNNTNAYSAAGQMALTIPVYKRFSLSLTSIHTFLNNPPPGFRKNSFQFTTGLTYSLK